MLKPYTLAALIDDGLEHRLKLLFRYFSTIRAQVATRKTTITSASMATTYPSNSSLSGKVVIVTGSSKGIGAALAVELAKRGAKACQE